MSKRDLFEEGKEQHGRRSRSGRAELPGAILPFYKDRPGPTGAVVETLPARNYYGGCVVGEHMLCSMGRREKTALHRTRRLYSIQTPT
jgi:hypothetical protein